MLGERRQSGDIFLIVSLVENQSVSQGRVKKFMLGKLVDFSIKWVGGVSLVH